MKKYTLINAIESCFAEIPAIVAIEEIDNNYNVLNTRYYDANTLPLSIEDYPVEYIDMIEQHNGSKVLCFIAFERGGKSIEYYN